jgi:hypothetical protein
VTTLAAPTLEPAAPPAQPLCPGDKAAFAFPSGAAGAALTGVTVNDTHLCSVGPAPAYNVTCAAVGAPAAVSLVATFGDKAKGDDCTTPPKDVALAVTLDPAITATIAATASDDVCPGATGAVAFTVVPSAPLKAAPAATLMSVVQGGSPVALSPQPSCTVTADGAAWAVACRGVQPGSYALAVDMTSDLGECAPPVGVRGRLGGEEGEVRGLGLGACALRARRPDALPPAPLPFAAPLLPLPGCTYSSGPDTSNTAAVTTIAPPKIEPAAQPAQVVCPNAAGAFSFSPGASGATLTGVVSSNPGLCGVGPAPDYAVTCASVAAPGAVVTLTAKYGNPAAGDDCATEGKPVALAVAAEPQITVAGVKAASAVVCPAASGAVAFEVTTNIAPANLTGSLVASRGGSPVAGPSLRCASTAGAHRKVWTVACTGVPAGSYAVKVAVTSKLGEAPLLHGGAALCGLPSTAAAVVRGQPQLASVRGNLIWLCKPFLIGRSHRTAAPLLPPPPGCLSEPAPLTTAGAVATVTAYDYTLTARAPAASARPGSRASANITLTPSAALAGAMIAAAPQAAGVTCTRTGAAGVVFQCSNMDRDTAVVFTATKNGGRAGAAAVAGVLERGWARPQERRRAAIGMDPSLLEGPVLPQPCGHCTACAGPSSPWLG